MLLALLVMFVQGASGDTFVGGVIPTNTRWTVAGSPYIVTGSISVSAGVSLVIDPGVTVQVPQAASLQVLGSLSAIGTKTSPIKFQARTGQPTCGGIVVQGVGYSPLVATGILEYCDFANVDGSAGTAIYSSYASLNVSRCTFTNTLGDAILPFHSRITVVENVISNVAGQGVRESYCAGLIASNRVSHVTVYANAVDLNYMWEGPGDSTIRVIGNVLWDGLNPNADGIDTGSVTTDISDNTIWGFGDKGISLGEQTHGTVRNNLVYNCVKGIAVKDGSDSVMANNTIVGCGVGIASFYKYGPTGGRGSSTNNIIWDCGQAISNDVNSTLSVSYCDVQGGWAGTGNINTNPLFANPAAGDYRLLKSSPCVDGGTNMQWMSTATDLAGNPRITHGTADIGAYEFGYALKLAIQPDAMEGDGVLPAQGGVSMSEAQAFDLAITLSSSDSTEVTVPAGITIAAGLTNATFDLTIVDDTETDGDQTAVVTATATAVWFTAASLPIVIHDEPVVIPIKVAQTNDDARQAYIGRFMDVSSPFLPLGRNGVLDSAWTGVRFAGIPVGPDMTITNAFIQFTVYEATNVAMTNIIWGQLTNDARPFTVTISDISSRRTTAGSVVWSQTVDNVWAPAGLSGVDQQTPDLSTLMNELIEQPDWVAGNAVVFVFSNCVQGRKLAYSFDGNPAFAPVLHLMAVPKRYWLGVSTNGCGSITGGNFWVRTNYPVLLRASAAPHYRFGGWAGDVAGVGNTSSVGIAVTMSTNRTLMGNFEDILYTNGVTEFWLSCYYPSTNNFTNTATSDTDGDGASASEEYVAGTDPTNSQSRLAVTDIMAGGTGTSVSWTGGNSVTQYLEMRADLVSTTDQWIAISTNIPPTPTTTNYLDPSAGPARFYRIRAVR